MLLKLISEGPLPPLEKPNDEVQEVNYIVYNTVYAKEVYLYLCILIGTRI